MKQLLQSTKLLVLMLMITAVFLAACDVEPMEITQIPLGSSPTANLTVTEVAVKVVTPEPTPTTPVLSGVEGAVCTLLPDDMTIDIQFESNLHGVIEVTGLQPGEKPTLLLTGKGKVSSDWWRKETQYENAVADNGRMSYRFDFRSWPSVEAYTFQGQLIHNRGVACFDIDLPASEVPGGRTVNGRIISSAGEHDPLFGVKLQLKPGGAFVAETDTNGRFTLTNLSFSEINVSASHLHFVIPAGDEPLLDLGDIEYPPFQPLVYQLDDYPPRERPYRMEGDAFWLVHTPEGEFFAFSPLAPTYNESIDGAECRYGWNATTKRFIDPCSGDEWDLDGQLSLEHSSELWSQRDLDRYAISVQDGTITVYLDRLSPGSPLSVNVTPTPPLSITETSETDAIISRLQTLQAQYEQSVDGYEGWVHTGYTDYFPTALRGSQEAINFLWLADTWVWESWYEIVDGTVNRHITHISDEDEGIWQRQLIADGWSIFVLPTEMVGGRVQPYDYLPVYLNTLGGTSWLIQLLQERRNPTVTAWEADDLYHVVIEETQEAPTEMVGLPDPVTTSRYYWVFDTETGLLQQQSSEVLLSTGEWQSTGDVTYTQFELLSQLPANAAATLAEGTTLLAQP